MPLTVRLGLARRLLLPWLLVVLWLCNLCDVLLTRAAIAAGLATEVNSLMGFFLQRGTAAAVGFKLAVVSLGVVLLWRARRYALTFTLTTLLAIVFVALVTYQALWLR